MLIYGKNAVIEALREGQAERLFLAAGLKRSTASELHALAERAGVPVEVVPRIDLDQALRTTHHQGIAAELPEARFREPDAPFALARERGERLLLVVLDQITDPRNYGAIVRSAEALGAHGVVTEERRSAPLSAVVVKTSAGATSHLPLVQVKNLARYLAEIKERGVWLYGAAAEAAQTPEAIDWDRDAALVIGSEGTGLRRLIRDTCDDLVAIPLRGQIGSLNASVAAGILIYAVQRARDGAPKA